MSERTVIRLVSIVIAIAGVVILFNATTWGLRRFSAVVVALGSLSGDPAHYVAYAGPVVAYLILGTVLLTVGLLRALDIKQDVQTG